MRGQTTKACLPLETSSATLCQTLATSAGWSSVITWEVIACLPAGSSVRIDTSRSPNTVTAKVLGIGVAVMVKTCGGNFPLSLNASL